MKNVIIFVFLIISQVFSFEKGETPDKSNKISLNEDKKYTTDDLNVDISEEKCKIVIENLIKLLEDAYIYTEIRKNPPDPKYFKPVDLISELNNIKTNDRKYYDFFRDIKSILGKTKDMHLSIFASSTPNNIALMTFQFVLPFEFGIIGENSNDAKIIIKNVNSYLNYYTEEQKKFIEQHVGKSLKRINGTDPFDFIQNLNIEFLSCHNSHSIFTFKLLNAHHIEINSSPMTSKELSNIKFEFENENDFIVLDYYLYHLVLNQTSEEQFLNFYEKETKFDFKNMNPKSLFEIENKFNSLNNKLKENKDTKFWTYSTNDFSESFQCRVDEENKLNVFKQTSFLYIENNYLNANEIFEKCTELFYSNDYPIVGIEAFNSGGVVKSALYLLKLIQPKTLYIPHYSTKITKLIKDYVESNEVSITIDPDMYQRIDTETCKPLSKFEDLGEIIDDYGYGVKHHRSKSFGIFNHSDSKNHKKRREKYFKMGHTKKPTEIIIFTDSFSYSATSHFIKGLQETGGAILVGYMGNPKSDDVFDASQAPTFVGGFSNSDIYQNLKDCGFWLQGVSIYESFNYTYKEKNPTPREFIINPVDERVPIYEKYSDGIYDKFITEAKKIFKKYNTDRKCNPNNLDLLFDPNNGEECYKFENDIHAHGGYTCDPETKEWSNICRPYYCDLGYYFDKSQNKCITDICTENNYDENEDKNEKGKLETWHIILIVVGLILILGIIGVVLYFVKFRKKNTPVKIDTIAESDYILGGDNDIDKDE